MPPQVTCWFCVSVVRVDEQVECEFCGAKVAPGAWSTTARATSGRAPQTPIVAREGTRMGPKRILRRSNLRAFVLMEAKEAHPFWEATRVTPAFTDAVDY